MEKTSNISESPLFQGSRYTDPVDLYGLMRAKVALSVQPRPVEGLDVLELGPCRGWYTEALLQYKAKSVTGIELHKGTVEKLNKLFNEEVSKGTVVIEENDYHYSLINPDKKSYDVVFCAGVLYHSNNPFLVLENIINLDPKMIFIETFTYKTFSTPSEPFIVMLNYEHDQSSPGLRQSERKILQYSFQVSDDLLIKMMQQYGYRLHTLIDKEDLSQYGIDFNEMYNDFEKNIPIDIKLHIQKWLHEMSSMWFVKA
jgi:SAM-dependent methyltransferase